MQRIVERNDFFVMQTEEEEWGWGVRGGGRDYFDENYYKNISWYKRYKCKKKERGERENKEKEKMCRRMMMWGIGVNDYNTNNSPKFDDHRKDKTRETKSRENKKK